MNAPCPYCGKKPQCVSAKEIYPHRPDLWSKWIWICHPCDAYVGCHQNTKKPLGRFAEKELRKWKKNAHASFDPVWKSRRVTRETAYAKLADAMEIPVAECHIGMFNVAQCKAVLRIVPTLLTGEQ